MKGLLRLILMLAIFSGAWNPCGTAPALLLGAPQNSASHLPDAPPPGTPTPGNPEEIRPARPSMPPDFLEIPKEQKRPRKVVDFAQAQKDAEVLAALTKKVQDELGHLSKNLLSEDLDADLKHIQKLAKHLREEITP